MMLSTPAWTPDPLTCLFHKLIRYYNGDDFDPFTVGGDDLCPDRLERHCFYYSLVMSESLTLLFDNHGRGGMCDIADPAEIGAVWRTSDLLASFFVTFEQLRLGTAEIGQQAVPYALFDQNADLRAALLVQ